MTAQVHQACQEWCFKSRAPHRLCTKWPFLVVSTGGPSRPLHSQTHRICSWNYYYYPLIPFQMRLRIAVEEVMVVGQSGEGGKGLEEARNMIKVRWVVMLHGRLAESLDFGVTNRYECQVLDSLFTEKT
jgi:hypothetical protein